MSAKLSDTGHHLPDVAWASKAMLNSSVVDSQAVSTHDTVGWAKPDLAWYAFRLDKARHYPEKFQYDSSDGWAMCRKLILSST